MSQSENHKNLVIEIATTLEKRYPMISIVADLQQVFGASVPPIVNGFRPDIYGKVPGSDLSVIAEAKTSSDLDNKHTKNQITAFLCHLEKKSNGLFILAVQGHGANRGKSILRFIRQYLQIKNTNIEIFDQQDFWLLESTEGRIWHLN